MNAKKKQKSEKVESSTEKPEIAKESPAPTTKGSEKSGKAKFMCQDCEWCYHDLRSKEPKPCCTHAEAKGRALGEIGMNPDWCPRLNEPEISAETKAPIPDTCGKCQFFYHGGKDPRSEKDVPTKCTNPNPSAKASVNSRPSDCPLAKE